MQKLRVYQDYYPFGSIMSGRGFNSGTGKFGFNGMLKDDEVKGAGNSYLTDYRLYDPRLSRWISPDLIVKHWESVYASFSNNPLFFIDPSGLDPVNATGDDEKKGNSNIVNGLKCAAQNVVKNEVVIILEAVDVITYLSGWEKIKLGVKGFFQKLEDFGNSIKGERKEATGGLSIEDDKGGQNPYGTSDNPYVRKQNYKNVIDLNYSFIEGLEAINASLELYDDFKTNLLKQNFATKSNKETFGFLAKYLVYKPALAVLKDEAIDWTIKKCKEAFHNGSGDQQKVIENLEKQFNLCQVKLDYYMEGSFQGDYLLGDSVFQVLFHNYRPTDTVGPWLQDKSGQWNLYEK